MDNYGETRPNKQLHFQAGYKPTLILILYIHCQLVSKKQVWKMKLHEDIYNWTSASGVRVVMPQRT